MTPKLVKVTLRGDLVYEGEIRGTLTANPRFIYEEQGVPVSTWLQVSDEPLEGAKELSKLADYGTFSMYSHDTLAERPAWSNGSSLLEFCNDGLTNFFGAIPSIIYWRIPHETH